MAEQITRRVIGRPLDQTISTFNIGKSVQGLKSEPAWEKEGRNSIILHKEDRLKIALIAMRAGNEIPAHKAKGPIAVQVIEGSIRFSAGADSHLLQAGDIFILRSEINHGVKADKESAFLLTLSGPSGKQD